MTLSVPEWDALMVRATSDAARPLAPSAKAGHEVERDLEDALAASLVRAAKPVTAAYLITGGTQNEWKKSGLGAYFAAGIRPVGAIDLIRANPKAWADLMYVHKDGRLESSGRPQTIVSKLPARRLRTVRMRDRWGRRAQGDVGASGGRADRCPGRPAADAPRLNPALPPIRGVAPPRVVVSAGPVR